MSQGFSKRNTLATPSGRVVNFAYAIESDLVSGTTTMPEDDTIPQSSEGVEALTVSITPKAIANLLRIDVSLMLAHSSTTAAVCAALFQDSTADALAYNWAGKNTTANGRTTISFTFWMVAGTLSSTTFKVRIGSPTAGTIYLNGRSGSRVAGGVAASSISITEHKA